MDRTEIIVAMAQAIESTNARALRIEGVKNVLAVKKTVALPVIGIVKREQPSTQIVITPEETDIEALAGAGADIIAIDATFRDRPVPVTRLIDCAKEENLLVMADCSTFVEGEFALSAGADILGTTLSGYTAETVDSGPEPDFELIEAFSDLTTDTSTLVMAEGRFNTPELAAEAIMRGADCVTVGSAITRIEHVVEWFTQALVNPSQCTH